MEKAIYIITIGLLFYAALPLFSARRGKAWWWIAVMIHGLLLSVFIVLFSNAPSLIHADQVGLLGLSAKWDQRKSATAKQFINDHLLCIDVANDRDLVYTEDRLSGQPVMEMITQRKKLLSFLEMLRNHGKNIDLIVVDIGFDIRTSVDCQLRDVMFDLYGNGHKLLLAGPPPAVTDSCSQLPAGIYGRVSNEVNDDGQLVSHAIISDGQTSLAYQVYTLLSGVQGQGILFDRLIWETDYTGEWSLASNTFVPGQFIADIDLVNADSRTTQHHKDAQTRNYRLTYRQLGEMSAPAMLKFFIDELALRKASAPQSKNIVFIGSFIGADDVHTTVSGQQHGVTNIINTVCALSQFNHRLGLATVLLLFGFMTTITFFCVYSNLYRLNSNHTNGLLFGLVKVPLDRFFDMAKELEDRAAVNRFMGFLKMLTEIVIEEIHLLTLVIATIWIYSVSGNLINAAILLVYFSTINKFIAHYLKFL